MLATRLAAVASVVLILLCWCRDGGAAPAVTGSGCQARFPAETAGQHVEPGVAAGGNDEADVRRPGDGPRIDATHKRRSVSAELGVCGAEVPAWSRQRPGHREQPTGPLPDLPRTRGSTELQRARAPPA